MTYQITEAPNLDGMVQEDVFAFADAVRVGPIKAARIMFPDQRNGRVKAAKSLMHYAYNKSTAMQCRVRGDIVGASNYEAICDRIYKGLPDFARW